MKTIMKYIDKYLTRKTILEEWQKQTETNVADAIRKFGVDKKVTIGNMIYGVLGDMVTYAYLADYNEGKKTMYPVWDRDCSGGFGWSDFADCCRIYDVIMNKLDAE